MDRALPVRDAHMDETGILETVFAGHVSGGPVRNDRSIGIVAGILHSQGREDILPYELLVAISGDFFDQMTEQHISGIAVLPLLARLEIKRLVAEARHQLL